MPRKNLIRSDRLPYHVTARTNNKEDFHLPLPQMWDLLGSECQTLHAIFGVEFHALVLMPNHFHMLLTVPQYDLGKVMHTFMCQMTLRSNHSTCRSGHLFGGPYYRSLVNSFRYFSHALKYVYRNPVKAKLCPRVEEYQFSTLHGLLGSSHLPFPIYFTRTGMELMLPSAEPSEMLDWLNRPFPHEAEELIRKGLRGRVFDTITDRSTRKPYKLLDQLL